MGSFGVYLIESQGGPRMARSEGKGMRNVQVRMLPSLELDGF
jgi:hypothetical protein